MAPKLKLYGERRGRLIAIEPTDQRRKGSILWLCICDCGEQVLERAVEFRRGKVRSCGCLQKEFAKKASLASRAVRTLPEGEASFRMLLGYYKRRASVKGLTWELTLEEVRSLFQGNCYLCGAKPSNGYIQPDLNGPFAHNGIDRVDNNKGYSKGNCLSCCGTCNRMKGQRSAEEFLAHVDQISRHANGEGILDGEGRRISGDTEQSIFAALGLEYVPPEERE